MKPDVGVDDDLMVMLEGDTMPCRVWPEQDEGPYHRQGVPTRQDVAEDRVGVPLRFAVRLVNSDDLPAAGAVAEIWHCDALGRYSGFPAPTADDATESDSRADERARDETYLRGAQPTDGSGTCEFRTIYPGWYPGRTVHIHLRARFDGETYTSQLYFPDTTSEAVFTLAPYRDRPGRDTTNTTDEIFAKGGEASMLRLKKDRNGYKAVVCFALGDLRR